MTRERYIDPTAGPLSAERMNPLLQDLEDWARTTLDELTRSFFESGYPVGSEPQPPYEQYVTLVRLRDAGSPLFWNDPQAPADLAELEQRFGRVAPMALPDQRPEPVTPQLIDQAMAEQAGQLGGGQMLQFGQGGRP